MLGFFKKDKKEESHTSPPVDRSASPLIVFVIDSNKSHDWSSVFKGAKVNGRDVQIETGGWEEFNLTCYSNSRYPTCYVDLKKTDRVKTFNPDFLLIRNQVRGLTENYVNLLYGFKYANIPSINSISSIYNCIERPWVFGELIAIKARLGSDVFPLIDQNYYPNHREMIIGPQFPAVVKVGHAHAGYGKMRIQDHHYFADFASVIALNKDYVTAEPFYIGEYDLRIQKIGDHYRVYKRNAMGNNWKTNTGTSVIEEIPLTDQYKLWADECSKAFGGLEILAVDAIHTESGKEYILEVNDTAIGLAPSNELADMGHIRDLILKQMSAIYPEIKKE